MLYQTETEGVSRSSGEKIPMLSSHIETWGPRNECFVDGDAWTQLSLCSSEMNKMASPFDDIGYLAGGGVGRSAPMSAKNTNTGEPSSESQSNPAAGPSLGTFFETAKSAGMQAVEQEQVERQQLPRRSRLDRTISKRGQFHDEEASLALSAAIKSLKPQAGTRNLFEFSKNSIGLSALGVSKIKPSSLELSKKSFGASKNSTSRNSASKQNSRQKNKNHDSSKSSFGFSGTLGASKSSAEGSRTIGSKISSMMRSKADTNRQEAEKEINVLQGENTELLKENRLFQAKLAEMTISIAKYNALKEWRSLEELAHVTTEMCEYKTLCALAELQIEHLEGRLSSCDHLIGAKERSICNLDQIRNTQEKRIGYLEVQCLENGINICETGSLAPTSVVDEHATLEDDKNDDENSFASFQEEPIDDQDTLGFALGNLGRPDDMLLTKSTRLDQDLQGVSELTKQSASSSNEAKNDSWVTLDMGASKSGLAPPFFKVKVPATKNPGPERNGVPLESYFATSLHETAAKGAHMAETDTWAPQTVTENAFGPGSGDHIPPPPPGATDRIQSAPPPSTRKTLSSKIVVSRPCRSKSPGTRRRRLKDSRPKAREDILNASEGLHNSTLSSKSSSARHSRRSKSPGTRRRLKDHGKDAIECKPLKRSVSMSHGAPSANSKSSANLKFELDRSSNHSLGRVSGHRRRSRQDSDNDRRADTDRRAVSTALKNALGSSLLLDDLKSK